ncbi:MAG: type II toxin-antitoxin system RelE/ParE family toxin [Alphaproteobacteria bacterium]|nr:type II toxin-antitoxin system RelE/ParE family toxin [Alphaproteobacteria bacterium]MDP6567123.1 type II toxin-antitoxin system RelE/ParE family toxin [Alphaproteobacteria bacterium]MDP6813969.1 type II toxin-antitoxin system RelE/ParE family toxin [Alphaproteobacteria bacterium]
MPEVLVTPAAEADLDDIWLYIAKDSPATADRFVDDISDRFRILAEHPMMGVDCAAIMAGLRYFPVQRYLIFYSRIEGGVLIERVLHGARDITELFD